MFYIKLNDNMDLVITMRESIYRNDNLSQKIIYLIPFTVGEIETVASCVYLNYIRADGTADVVELERLPDRYNESYLQYTFPIKCDLTRYAGSVCTWIHFFAGNPDDPMTRKTGECTLQIKEAKNIDAYIGDNTVTALYQMKKEMDDGFDAIESELDGKADNITFNPEDSTIQLTANGVPIGDAILVSSGVSGVGVADIHLSESGELIVAYTNGTEKNLGSVVSRDGKVYIPHLSSRKVLTWTIEDKSGEIPDPVDLNPYDEWGQIDESEVNTEYVWEPI